MGKITQDKVLQYYVPLLKNMKGARSHLENAGASTVALETQYQEYLDALVTDRANPDGVEFTPTKDGSDLGSYCEGCGNYETTGFHIVDMSIHGGPLAIFKSCSRCNTQVSVDPYSAVGVYLRGL